MTIKVQHGFVWFTLCFCCVFSQDKCQAPGDVNGVCITASQCDHIKGIIANNQLSLEDKQKSLSAYKCAEGKACCPVEEPRNEKACPLPNNNSGMCIDAVDCDFVKSIVKNNEMSYTEKKNTLAQYKCGEGKICCPAVTQRIAQDNAKESDLLPHIDECGKFKIFNIFGGEETGIYEFPWAVLLYYRQRSSKGITRTYNCGGTLINNRYVLTAAHCVNPPPPYNNILTLISARLGENDISKDQDCDEVLNKCNDPPIDLPIDEKIVHEKYNNELRQNDIALLRLARNVSYSDFIKPICLPLTQREINDEYIGENLTVTGWGLTEKGGKSKIKLKVALPILARDECKTKFSLVTSNHMCAGGEDMKDSCGGDSGGGLIHKDHTGSYILSGIVSYGLKFCGTEGYPGVYAKVGNYIDWIIKNMRP